MIGIITTLYISYNKCHVITDFILLKVRYNMYLIRLHVVIRRFDCINKKQPLLFNVMILLMHNFMLKIFCLYFYLFAININLKLIH